MGTFGVGKTSWVSRRREVLSLFWGVDSSRCSRYVPRQDVDGIEWEIAACLRGASFLVSKDSFFAMLAQFTRPAQVAERREQIDRFLTLEAGEGGAGASAGGSTGTMTTGDDIRLAGLLSSVNKVAKELLRNLSLQLCRQLGGFRNMLEALDPKQER